MKEFSSPAIPLFLGLLRHREVICIPLFFFILFFFFFSLSLGSLLFCPRPSDLGWQKSQEGVNGRGVHSKPTTVLSTRTHHSPNKPMTKEEEFPYLSLCVTVDLKSSTIASF